MPQQYPFSAIVGCEADHLDPMGLALILSTISPEIGGVLIRGEKGTAKSTAVRALAAVLPPVAVYEGDRFSIDPDDPSAVSLDLPDRDAAARTSRPVRLVELPVGATEDRVLGSLQLESALSKGEVTFEPGLLARAHRGILYVDEVNLLHDHLVDLLLDAAAMGRATIERDGISVEHAARFVLIGTMNPEEGELRPQLLDRFGLTVEVVAPREPGRRVEVVRRRLAFDANPPAFAASFAADEEALRARIGQARARLAAVRLSDNALAAIARVCAGFEVDGLRADIVTARAAVAHAAWAGRATVTRADIRQAALLALPHRRRRNPFDAPGLDEDLLDRLLGDEEPDPRHPARRRPGLPTTPRPPTTRPPTTPRTRRRRTPTPASPTVTPRNPTRSRTRPRPARRIRTRCPWTPPRRCRPNSGTTSPPARAPTRSPPRRPPTGRACSPSAGWAPGAPDAAAGRCPPKAAASVPSPPPRGPGRCTWSKPSWPPPATRPPTPGGAAASSCAPRICASPPGRAARQT